MADIITDLGIYLNFENVDEKDIYDKLDLLLQFLLKNNLKGTIVINRHQFAVDDSGDD